MSKKFRGLIPLAAASFAAIAPGAHANPIGGDVVAGSASISTPAAGNLAVTQHTDKAVINWQGFSIGQNESVNFAQPSSSSIALNRVVGGDLSTIAGSLSANGNVYLVNPNGVVFTRTSRVDVNGLMATTSDISNADFMAGRYNFTIPGKPGASIVNAGRITAAQSGLVGLVAPSVENDGIIAARLGRVSLASGDAFTLDLYGDQLISFLVPTTAEQNLADVTGALITNKGTISADGGTVWLAADTARRVVDQAIDTTGVIEASAVHQHGGDIVLDGGDNGGVTVAGILDASGTETDQTGGTVKVLGAKVALTDTAKVDVSGGSGGGTAHVGGNFHGAGPERNAKTTTMEAGATINANAIGTGNGGQVAVWSDGQTNFSGSISARGGSQSGNGGFVEVSGRKLLDYAGAADLRAINGVTGSLLLDPENVTIATVGDSPTLPSSPTGPILLNANGDSSLLSVSTLQSALALADVTVTTGSTGSQAGDITVANTVSWSSDNSLTLSAYRNITINDSVVIANTGAGDLNLHADSTGTGVGTVVFNGVARVTYAGSTGLVSLFYNPSDNPSGSIVNASSYLSPTDYSTYVLTNGSVPDQFSPYMLVNSVYDLQNIQNNLLGDYALGKNIDASATVGWNSGAGFSPIGKLAFAGDKFFGVLDGQGHTIDQLDIYSNAAGGLQALGLFGWLGDTSVIRNFGVTNANISFDVQDGYSAGGNVGVLAGVNDGGDVSQVYTSGAVTIFGTGPLLYTIISAGGLVGENDGKIENSYSLAAVSVAVTNGNDWVGGLVGGGGDISTSYAAGALSAAWLGTTNAGLGGPRIGGLTTGSASVVNSYWDTESTGQSTSVGGTGLTTAQMKSGLPSGFDNSVWDIDSSVNSGYPYLKWQTTGSGGSSTPVTVNFGTLASLIELTWSVADGNSTYGTLGSLGAGSLFGVLSGDAGSVDATLGLYRGSTPVVYSAYLPAGTYTGKVVGLTGTASSSYSLASTGNTEGTFIINPKALHWSVDDASFAQGSTAVRRTANLFGIVNSDAVFGSVEAFDRSTSVPIISSMPVRSYAEKVTGLTGDDSSNYILASTGNTQGTLIVTAPALYTNTPSKAEQQALIQVQGVVADSRVGQTGSTVDQKILINTPGNDHNGNPVNLWGGGFTTEEIAGAAIQYAFLADAAYSNDISVQTPNGIWTKEESWRRVLTMGFLSDGLSADQVAQRISEIAKSGFDAGVYTKDGQYVVAYRGTDGLTSAADWGTNFHQQIYGPESTTQYQAAVSLARYVEAQTGAQIVLTGHSLGGGLAQYAASQLQSKPRAITFNAAGIMSGTYIPKNLDTFGHITNIIVKDDPVTPFGQQLGAHKYWIDNPDKISLIDPTIFGHLDVTHGTQAGGDTGPLTFVINALKMEWNTGVYAAIKHDQ